MKKIIRVFNREIRNLTRYRSFMALSVGLPLLAICYFLVLFKTGVPREFPIAVMDNDNSTISRKVTRMIDAAPSVSVAYHLSSMDEGEDLMKKGKINAIVELPRDMEKLIYSIEQANVGVFITGANVTKNGLIDKDIRTVLYSFSVGIQMQTLIKQGFTEEQAYDMAMPIYFEKHVLFNPYISYQYYLIPIFLPMMLLIFILLSTIFTFALELKNSTAPEWLAMAGGSIWAAILGKILPYTIIFMFLAFITDSVMFGIVGVPMNGNIFMIMALDVVFIMAYQSLGILIAILAGNLRKGLSIGGGYSVLAFTLSGYTYPMLAMVPTAQAIAHLFPMTFYMRIFVDQAMRGAPAAYSIPSLLCLAIFILLPIPLIPRLKRMCRDEKYWGKL